MEPCLRDPEETPKCETIGPLGCAGEVRDPEGNLGNHFCCWAKLCVKRDLLSHEKERLNESVFIRKEIYSNNTNWLDIKVKKISY